ncbi:MAG TPA: hypothetical protein VFJ99_06200, partial [Solirubrobacterales bacterium]|nr:hypothetical protein [Solirubrobacterales bacterium]
WNGAVEPRVVLRELYPLEGAGNGLTDTAPTHVCECGEAEWWHRFEAELRRPLDERPATDGPEVSTNSGIGRERHLLRRECEAWGSATARIAELVSSGAGVLAVCADASRRAALAGGATGLARFNGGAALVACHRCAAEAVAALADRAGGGLALSDYAALVREPALAAGFEHVVLVDPPASPVQEAAAVAAPATGEAFLHRLWGEPELPFARAALAEQWASREGVAAAFRALREAGEVSGTALREALAGAGPNPLCPEAAARRLRVLGELELVRGGPGAGGGVVGVVSSGGTDLQRSGAFRAYDAAHAEAQRFLERPKLP